MNLTTDLGKGIGLPFDYFFESTSELPSEIFRR